MTGSCSDVGPMVDTILVNWAVHFPLRDASVVFIVLLAMSDSVDVVDDVDDVDVESDIVRILVPFVADGKAEAVSLLALLREVISCFVARVNIFVNVEDIMGE